jgi:hypothetical protein
MAGSAGRIGVVPVDGRWSLDADGDRAAAVRGRPPLQGLLPARRGCKDQLREPVPPGPPRQWRRRLGGVAPAGLRLGGEPRRRLRPASRRDPAGPGRDELSVASRGRLVPGEMRWQGPTGVGPSPHPSVGGLVQRRPGVARRVRQGVRRAGVARSSRRPADRREGAAGVSLQRGGVRRPRVALCGVAAQDAGLPLPARQAEGRARRDLAGGEDGAAAARPPG